MAQDHLCYACTGGSKYDIQQFCRAGIAPYTFVQLPQCEEEQCQYDIVDNNIFKFDQVFLRDSLKAEIKADI